MSGLKILGLVLIIGGAVVLGYDKLSYKKEHELFRIGGQSASFTTKEKVPKWVGFTLIGGGLILLFVPKKKA